MNKKYFLHLGEILVFACKLLFFSSLSADLYYSSACTFLFFLPFFSSSMLLYCYAFLCFYFCNFLMLYLCFLLLFLCFSLSFFVCAAPALSPAFSCPFCSASYYFLVFCLISPLFYPLHCLFCAFSFLLLCFALQKKMMT